MPGKNHSPLLEAVPDQRRYPVLTGPSAADVIMIGGGIAGIMAAWRLAELGQSVILLEQNHLATGDTGLTTAFVTRVPDTPLEPLAKRYGQPFVTNVFRATRSAQQYLRTIIEQEKIDCDWHRCNSYNLSYTAHNPQLKEEWLVVKEADDQAAFVTAADDPNLRPPHVEAIRFADEGYFTVRQFIFGLLKRPTAQRINVFEESPVSDVIVHRRGVTVTTAQGTVEAKRLIIATGQPPEFFSELRTLFTASLTYAVAVRYNQGLPISHNTFWDTDEPYQYYRPWDEQTMILGGADHRLLRDPAEGGGQPQEHPTGSEIKPHDQLAEFLDKRFPGPHTVTHQWSGSLFTTTDGLPFIAEHPHYRGRVYIACGFNGSGMVFGALSGMILGDLATGKNNEHAKLFDFARAGVTVAKPPQPTAESWSRAIQVWRWLLPIVFLVVMAIPTYIFFDQRGGLKFLESSDVKSFGLKIFPLVGLYAFTLVWFQLMIGSSMDILRRVYSWIEGWHRKEGVFVLLFALLHPLLLMIGIGPVAYRAHTYIDDRLVIYTWIGVFQLFLICLTAGTALLRKTKLVKKYWRTIHYANYLVFVSVWIHSWYLGSDVQHTNLKYLWYFFAISAVASTIGRIIRSRRPAMKVVGAPITLAGEQFITVAKLEQIVEGQPFCAKINGKTIAVFKFGEKFYAIDNVCTHAGGPLCEGIQMGSTIECPLHQSVFDIATGAVKEGPATRPQQTYEVKIVGQEVKIKV